LLIPLILFGILSGAGMELFCLWLRKIPCVRRMSANVLMFFLAALISMTCMLRVALRKSNDMIPIFIKSIISDAKRDTSVYCIDFKNTSKISGLTAEFPNIKVENFELWSDAIKQFTNRQYENRDFYFCVEMPRTYRQEDFKNWFRSRYYVYPFDLIQDYCYRKQRYLLLKFNHKTAAKNESMFDKSVFGSDEKNFVFQQWRNVWYYCPFMNDLSINGQMKKGFFSSEKVKSIGSWLFIRNDDKAENPDIADITYHNSLLWPEEKRIFRISFDNGAISEGRLQSSFSSFEKSAIPSDEPPLLLIPPYVTVSETSPTLFLTNCVPAYRQETDNFSFAGNKTVIPVTEHDKTIHISVSEHASGRSASGDLQIKWLKKSFAANESVSVLMIEDTQFAKLNLEKEVSVLLSEDDNKIDFVRMKSGASSSFDFSAYEGWLDKKYHAIIMNILLDPIARPWSFPFQTGPTLDRLLSEYVAFLHKKYPAMPCFIILPPSPVDLPSFFTLYCNSPQLSRLSHYRVCDAVQRWYIRTNPENVYLIPLYFDVDPENDYCVHTKIDGKNVYSGYAFKPEVIKRLAGKIVQTVLHHIN